MLEGENYTKLILIDGKPLDAKTQKKVAADLEKTRAECRGNHLRAQDLAYGFRAEARLQIRQ